MVAVVVHHVVSSYECGHVATCFIGQVGINFPIVALSTCSAHGFAHLLRPCIVGREDEIPIAINIIEVFEILGGSPTGFVGVHALINETVYLQVVAAGCSDHKLPEAGGSSMADGRWVET